MEASLSELVATVYERGATLRSDGRHLDLLGNLDPDLLSTLTERREELVTYLTWDQEEAHSLMRRAWVYVGENYTEGTLEALPEALEPSERKIGEAYYQQDMWTYRLAVREWVVAWLTAIQAKRKEVAA